MRLEATDLPGVVRVEPARLSDARGFFVRTFCAEFFAEAGLMADFPQMSLSHNRAAGTLRGLHFQQPPFAETKLVRCVRGAVFDVAVDLRPDAPTYLRWTGLTLSAENGTGLYIPAGFAHGFQTLTDEADVAYAITPAFRPGHGDGLRFDDPAVGVRWPLPVASLSDKDRAWPLVAARGAVLREAAPG